MIHVIRTLGLTNPRFAALMSLTFAVLAVAILSGQDSLYGIAAAAAFVAGTVYDREICCDVCGTSLEERES